MGCDGRSVGFSWGGAGWFLREHLIQPSRGKLFREGPEKFINPLLGCEIAPDKEVFKEFGPIQEAIQNTVNTAIKNGKLKTASVYFRALNSGRWTGVNEDEKFSPASLLKIPIMIAYYSLAEQDPSTLQKKILFDGSSERNTLEDIKPSQAIKSGELYTINDLIYRMIVYSDNDARYLLVQDLDPKKLAEIYTDLGIPLPQQPGAEDFMSTKTYFTFFQVLYNASYLERPLSEKALEVLSKTDFKDGIVKGIPPNFTVAHKFGERVREDSDGSQVDELHDCGIIYYPHHPYMLCVMTKGSDFSALSSVLADISHTVYKGVETLFAQRQ